MEKGEWVHHVRYEVDLNGGIIIGMVQEEKYRYIGYLLSRGIDHKGAKQKSVDTYFNSIRSILRSKFSARKMAKVIITYATSALTFSFGITRWTIYIVPQNNVVLQESVLGPLILSYILMNYHLLCLIILCVCMPTTRIYFLDRKIWHNSRLSLFWRQINFIVRSLIIIDMSLKHLNIMTNLLNWGRMV